tara:strand:- start:6 stop:884 length:879 start_codon:yes stop_codon:yes gene_type:complete
MLIKIFYLFNLAFSIANIEYASPSDSIFVGNITSLQVTVNGLKNGEFPNFFKLNNNSLFTSTNSILDDKTIIYNIQFWNSGKISIPPIKIDIMKNNKFNYSIYSDSIHFSVYSNLLKNGNMMRPIKPMKQINLLNMKKIIFMAILILLFFILLSSSFIKLKKNKFDIIKKNNLNTDIYKHTLMKINELHIPINNNLSEIENYYSKLTYYIKKFLKNKIFIRATEMTTNEISIFFKKNNFNKNLISKWTQLNENADRRKYAGMLPDINTMNVDKESFLELTSELNKNIENNLQ